MMLLGREFCITSRSAGLTSFGPTVTWLGLWKAGRADLGRHVGKPIVFCMTTDVEQFISEQQGARTNNVWLAQPYRVCR